MKQPSIKEPDDMFCADVSRFAAEAFESGLFCAESVVLAIAKARGIESALLPKIATAFCSGLARTCGPCGALTGAIMGVSMVLGRMNPAETVQTAYGPTQQLIREFEGEFGSQNCKELLGCDVSTAEGQLMFREKGLRHQCARYTARAAEMAARLISASHM